MKGVLLVNLGTPDSPSTSDVRKYLKEFLLDKRVIDIPWIFRQLLVRGIIAPFRANKSAKLYKELWTENGSPLKYYGEKLEDSLQAKLGSSYLVQIAMRYQNPSIEKGIENLIKKGATSIIVFPLFPQYASATTGSIHEEVMRIMMKFQTIIPINFINSYPTHPKMIKSYVVRSSEYDVSSFDHVLFSFHGLPVRQLRKADNSKSHCQKIENCCQSICEANQFCYSAQCHQTAYAIASQLNLNENQYSVCFQSRLGKDPWIQPYTSDIIEDLSEKGAKNILVFCPAFVADCLETTIEISVEYQEEFTALGGKKIQLVESLNDHPLWVETISDIILEY